MTQHIVTPALGVAITVLAAVASGTLKVWA
jgi:hypothetical protein